MDVRITSMPLPTRAFAAEQHRSFGVRTQPQWSAARYWIAQLLAPLQLQMSPVVVQSGLLEL